MLTANASPVFEVDTERFAQNFDLLPFEFGHRLADDPLFAPERLLELAKAMACNPSDVYYDAGNVRIDQRWDETDVCAIPIPDLLANIEHNGAWVILRFAEKDPEYAQILEVCLNEIEALSGRNLRNVMKLRNAIIFLTSPGRISAYHIDHECNCLLQIRGQKTVHVFDRSDRDVLPEEEIERFWAADNNAAIYKSRYEERAHVFDLSPGRAVHIPVNSPHWVQNGPGVSVSLSINFHYEDRLLGDVYRSNYWLRRLGLRPTPPHRSVFKDALKARAYGSARGLRTMMRRVSAKA